MRALSLALRGFAREWRSGALGVLLLALTTAVAALTGVGFLVDRVAIAVDEQATQVLAADLRVSSTDPIDPEYFREAARRGVRSAQTVSMLSVVFLGDQSELSDLEAVSAAYPLRGTLKVADEPFAAGMPASGIPGRGEAWPSSKLLATLGGKLGSTLSIGAATFRVTRVLISRPDQGGDFAELAPSIILNADDLPATRLIEPGSRVTYAALFAADRARVQDFRDWLIAHRKPGERLRDIAEASPQIKDAVDRAGRFLELASLASVLLCSIAVAMSARQYVRHHLDSVALLKTLGATRALALGVSLIQLLLVAIVAALAGSAIGFAAQEWLLHVLKGLINTELPPAGLAPLGMGFVAAIAVLAGFALPPLLQLARVPPLRVLRRDVGPPPPLLLLAFGPAAAAMIALIYWAVRDLRLFRDFVVGLSGFALVLVAAGFVLVLAAGRLRGSVGVAWRYGIANLSRRRAESLVQIVAFGTGLMALLLLGLVRRDLESDWRRTLPADAPNYFFINIPPGERAAFVDFLESRGAKLSRVLPMLRGRLTEINGLPVDDLVYRRDRSGRPGEGRGGEGRGAGEDRDGGGRGGEGRIGGRGEGFAEREQNLTWTATLGSTNRVVAGRWWTPQDYGKPLVSLATEFQQSLGLWIGDRLTFEVGGEPFTVTVANIREVKWDSFQPNFFIVFAPGVLDAAAGTYLTSAYFHPSDGHVLAELAHRFPSVSIFDVDDLLDQVRSLMSKAILAVQSVFAFTLFAGLTVLLAAVQASRDERRYESAMLRTLGASARTVLQGVLAEFTTVGLLAGLLAAGGASLAGAFVASRILQVPYTFDPLVFLVGMAGGAVLVGASGWIATRSAVAQPPVITLRAG